MKVREVKEILSHMDDEHDFEFRLYSGKDYMGEKHQKLEIKSRGTQMTTPPTEHIDFKVSESEVESETLLPNVFYINDRLMTLTRVEYKNGQVVYKEKSIDGRYKNAGAFY